MLERILLPRLDQGMEEGTVVEWLVEVGSPVAQGEPLVEIETEKVSTDIESPVDGVLLRIDHGAGSSVAVGTVIGWIGDGTDEPPATDAGPTAAAPERDARASTAPATAAPATTSSTAASEPPAAAAARSSVAPVAVEPLPIDRSSWVRPHASSPRERAATGGTASSASGAGPADEEIMLDRQRQAVVSTVTRSWQAPQFTLSADVDATRVVDLLEAWRSLGREPRLTFTDLLLAAIAAGVQAEPAVNAWFEQDRIRRFRQVDVTLLAQVGDRLLMPVVADVGGRPLAGIAAERARVVAAAREDRLAMAELRTGSIALSNLSATRVDRFVALLIPPQVAIVAVGRIRPVAGVPTVTLTLTLDHRVLDGVAGSRFLDAVVTALEEPLLLTT